MKEKMEQIFDAMADITLSRLNKCKETETILGEEEIQMVSATLQLYNLITEKPQPELFNWK